MFIASYIHVQATKKRFVNLVVSRAASSRGGQVAASFAFRLRVKPSFAVSCVTISSLENDYFIYLFCIFLAHIHSKL